MARSLSLSAVQAVVVASVAVSAVGVLAVGEETSVLLVVQRRHHCTSLRYVALVER